MGNHDKPTLVDGNQHDIVDKNFGEDEEELLNLIAEIIVEIIIKNSQNECDRLCEDQ